MPVALDAARHPVYSLLKPPEALTVGEVEEGLLAGASDDRHAVTLFLFQFRMPLGERFVEPPRAVKNVLQVARLILGQVELPFARALEIVETERVSITDGERRLPGRARALVNPGVELSEYGCHRAACRLALSVTVAAGAAGVASSTRLSIGRPETSNFTHLRGVCT